MPPALESLPSRWPFGLRDPLPPLEERGPVVLPGLGKGWTLRVAPGLELAPEGEGLEGAFGRGGILRFGNVVLRPYRRGGLLRHLNRRTYAGRGRFESEYAVHARLWEAGLPTVEPRGYGFRRHGLGWQGCYLTALATGLPWPRAWDRSDEVIPQLATMITALSDLGLWAPDLNATNVLLGAEGRVLLLDWDRAAFGAGGDLRPLYLARLRRSLARLGAPDPIFPALESALGGPGSR